MIRVITAYDLDAGQKQDYLTLVRAERHGNNKEAANDTGFYKRRRRGQVVGQRQRKSLPSRARTRRI